MKNKNQYRPAIRRLNKAIDYLRSVAKEQRAKGFWNDAKANDEKATCYQVAVEGLELSSR